MSWANIRPYFKTHLDAAGLHEHSDAFNRDNIPEDLLDGAYHVEFGDFIGVRFNQSDYQNNVQVYVRIFKNAFYDTQSGYDEMISIGEDVTKRIMKPTNRNGLALKQIFLNRMTANRFAESNDNSMFLEMDFTVTHELDVRA